MAKNTGKLAGKTLFISGASRGIGACIGLKAARDGANVVIAAKTAEPHPKLPGTIYTAAQDMENAGGKGLPCIVDIQNEEQVKAAVQQTVDKFGGIDILINNASAIHLTGTEATPMKRYDLMHHINTRGTFMCSKYCVPHLKNSDNPHILNISPPLSMKPKWFKDHVAYTMAKYGMSMCALGMAEEFREDGIAVNTLWPQTAIYTAAMSMLGGGDAVKKQCRKPEIMADAAYAILTKDSRSYTGNFAIDEDVLVNEGFKAADFKQYNYVENPNLLPDFFLDEEDPHDIAKQMVAAGATLAFDPLATAAPAAPQEVPSSGNPDLDKTFQALTGMLSPEMCQKIGGVFSFDLKDGGSYYLDLKNGGGAFGEGEAPSGADTTMILKGDDFVRMFQGKINPTTAFMTGKLKIKGDLAIAMKLEKLMKKVQAKL